MRPGDAPRPPARTAGLRAALRRSALGLVALPALACNGDFIDPTPDTHGTTDTSVASDGHADADTVAPGTMCQVHLSWDGAPLAASVAVAGDWNGFSTSAAPRRPADGLWTADLELTAGEHGFAYAVNGALEGPLGAGVPTHWVGGVEHRNLIVPDCGRPAVTVPRFAVKGGRVSAEVCFEPARDGAALATLTVMLDGEDLGLPVDGDGCVALDETLAPGKHRLDATATDTDDRTARDPAWLPFWVEAAPFDWRDATLYMAMPDRFRDSDGHADPVSGPEPIANWQGGDLPGLESAVDDGWFEALGVNALWLTPVVEQPAEAFVGLDGTHLYAGYHGYWPVSPDAIDARYGGEAAFRSLVAKAHAHGMRIVMDVVLNHVHEQHPYCAEGLCKTTCVCGTSGCDWDARARDCQFASYLPDLDYRDHATVVRVADDVLAFVRRFDIDGLRLDAVKHVDRSILQAVRQRLDAVTALGGAPFWLVGETFTGSDGRPQIMQYIDRAELDGQFDFPLYWSIRDAFVSDGSFRALEGALVASEQGYGPALGWMSPFLGNHDVPRLATAIAGNDLGPFGGTADTMAQGGATPGEWDIINHQSMAFAFLLTLRGVPLVYMGDELGLGGSNDPDNRRLLPRQADLTGNQQELLRRVRELGAARRAHATLRRGERRELWIDDSLYVQARWLATDALPSGEARVMVIAMNKGGDTRHEAVTIPSELGLEGKNLSSLFSARVLTVTGGQVQLELAPMEYAIFASE
ncbi:MAG: alpha-amylase family glycosyl hydrolase [Myxococcota bacterium]